MHSFSPFVGMSKADAQAKYVDKIQELKLRKQSAPKL